MRYSAIKKKHQYRFCNRQYFFVILTSLELHDEMDRQRLSGAIMRRQLTETVDLDNPSGRDYIKRMTLRHTYIKMEFVTKKL